MKYKVLILDLDGTTIPNRSDGLPSARIVDAVRKASEKVFVCAATSRPFFLAKSVLDKLTFTGPCVISSGTQLYDPLKKKIVREYLLNRSLVPHIYEVINKYRIKTLLYNGVTENLFDGGTIPQKVFTLYTWEMPPEKAEKLASELQEIPNIAVHRIPAWKKGMVCVEISDAIATKFHGITEIAKLLNTDTHEMIGVGDGYNDFPLLMACGLKIAMGNAVPELKAIADFIAPSVEEDGVATVIEKFILTG